MITIVDYGMGNLGSLFNMFKRIGQSAQIQSDPDRIKEATKLILPGVGAFDAAMEQINKRPGLRSVLDLKALEQKVPILGVCLGMQLLTNSSEEGKQPGLGWIPGKTIRFPSIPGLKVPHMGWNTVQLNSDSPITTSLSQDQRYYFVHSYYVRVDNPEHSMMKTEYGLSFDSGIHSENIFGVQFHPEKSHKYGMRLLENFCNI
jgi:glutamine amidotransferase